MNLDPEVKHFIHFSIGKPSPEHSVKIVPYQTKLKPDFWFCLAYKIFTDQVCPITGGFVDRIKFVKIFQGSPDNSIEMLRVSKYESCLLVLGKNPNEEVKSHIQAKIDAEQDVGGRRSSAS